MVVTDKEKETDQTNLHEVQTSECLVDCAWEEESASIDVTGSNDVEDIVLYDDPEQTECEYHEYQHQWGNDRVDEA